MLFDQGNPHKCYLSNIIFNYIHQQSCRKQFFGIKFLLKTEKRFDIINIILWKTNIKQYMGIDLKQNTLLKFFEFLV